MPNDEQIAPTPRQQAELIVGEHLDEMMSPHEYPSTRKALIRDIETAIKAAIDAAVGEVWEKAIDAVRAIVLSDVKPTATRHYVRAETVKALEATRTADVKE